MKFSQFPIQTHRENPANARSEGAALLVRGGYISHSGEILPLGQLAIERISAFSNKPDFFAHLGLSVLSNEKETYFPLSTGSTELLICPACGFVSRLELTPVKKTVFSAEAPAALEKVLTPDCPTIESLAGFLGVPQEKTAKALMFMRSAKSPDFAVQSQETLHSMPEFVFVVVRGDMTMSEAKLRALVGDIRLATEAEIRAVGAVPGYASPIGVKNALIVVDDLIPQSPNLIAGANEAGYHLKNVNCGRDYQPDLVADLALAAAGDSCANCGAPLEASKGWLLASGGVFDFEKILFALAESHHDEKGLMLPVSAAPFDVYLMHVPGKIMDTKEPAEKLYGELTAAGLSVFFDDRDERAGVKFNDADLIGCPLRVTVGERGLQNGMVEVKFRRETENKSVPLAEIISFLQK
jgi:prolyl-tRNA synthetase